MTATNPDDVKDDVVREKRDPYTPEVISRLTQGWFSKDHSGLVLITNDPNALVEDSPLTGIQFGLANFMAMLAEFDRVRALSPSPAAPVAGDAERLEIEIDCAANAMLDAENLVRNRHRLSFTDCRVLARLALEAAAKLRSQALGRTTP